jgi:dipeptidyl-peptidase-4
MIAKLKRTTVCILFSAACLTAVAQKKQLTDDQYFKNNFKGIVQPLPTFLKWVNDNQFVYVKDSKKILVDCKTGKEREATEAESKVEEETAAAVYKKENDLFIKINGAELQLTNDKEEEVNPTMSPDGKYVAYTKNNNLYTVNISGKKETALTTDGSDVILNGYASWVYTEEILGRASHYRSFWWSPDSKHIAYFRTDDTEVPIFTLTDGTGQHGYVETVRYPKVGDKNPEVKVGIVSPDGGNTTWANFNPKDDQYFGLPYWAPDGTALWVQWMNRLQNNLKIWSVNPANGSKKEFYNEEQKTWISLDDEGSRIQFLQDGKGVLLMSDATGWKHIYYYGMDGKLINAVTSGKFTVTDLNYVDEKSKTVYFTARSRENTARFDFYKVGMDGKNLQRLTFGDYSHTNINLSPNAGYFITTYSNTFSPNKTTLVNNKGKIIKELGDAKAAGFDEYELAKTALLRVKSDDGLYDLPMKVTWPVNMDKSKKYPVLISIYGGPDAGTCFDAWSLSGNQQWYAKEGLIQVVMDHRASGHFGKEGVNYMYHNLGYWEMKDYSTMVKWLIANGNADPGKICITGFSYGGYMTCYALTYGADVFTHGMAGGSVTDWTYYDSHYTERYMGTPANNAEGYKTGSVLTHTDKYKGKLQIVHGIIDDNVHMQNSINLISQLQDAKKDFEFMPYSGGRHGWPGNKWLHYLNMKTRFIYKYLLEKEVPKSMLR